MEDIGESGGLGILEEIVNASETDEAETGNAKSHHGATIEGEDERARLTRGASRLRRADVRVGRGLHAEITGEEREEGAREEGDARFDAACHGVVSLGARKANERDNGNEDDQRVEAKDLVFAREERHRPLTDEA